eukprot:CAMPEP_0170850510 /NCGR_PEP_ID=MMETSP0734-20130129/10659_1 /TAXON_ID=186038 /ORGANISM="Fragilariopsis kerguelensis, Strain L26-C5" /LENGTH=58 /DNA_ID=CAMNT_0011220409 /DNA_START=77 /DNA_END=253 /DNA_ORIENTATION=-
MEVRFETFVLNEVVVDGDEDEDEDEDDDDDVGFDDDDDDDDDCIFPDDFVSLFVFVLF